MIAFVRNVPSSYASATRAESGPPIDVVAARRQHGAYVDALGELGFAIERIEASDAHPDCVFVEDTAVLHGGRALITRSANPQRQGEHGPVAETLASAGLEVVQQATGTLDGGDVLRVRDTLFVSRSLRTDDAGIAGLAEAFEPVGLSVVPVDLPDGILHLKCVCTAPAPDVVVVADGTVRLPLPDGVREVRIPAGETYAANTVGLAGRVVVPQGYPATAAALAEAGLHVLTIEMSEFRAGDGSLTCLSLRWV